MRNYRHPANRALVPSKPLPVVPKFHRVAHSSRMRGVSRPKGGPALPPENWYEPSEDTLGAYQIITHEPGDGFVHPVTADEVKTRLQALPDWMLDPLQVVQLSRITRKKRSFPCYGMQWGNSLYLYPLEESLTEVFVRPPKPAVYNEAEMYGGRWEQVDSRVWHLHWTKDSIRDFYLNNILIHELGHLLDDRNSGSQDRERFAEWFAIEYGYLPTQTERRLRLLGNPERMRPVRRRHHAK